MALLPEIDKQKTIENVRDFFEHDFQRLQNMAHVSYVDIKAPIISEIPSNHGENNTSEEKLSNYDYARKMLNNVIQACDSIPSPYKDVLDYRYFKGLSWFQIEERLGYSTRRGQQLLDKSFLQFAEAFADVYDYRVFK